MLRSILLAAVASTVAAPALAQDAVLPPYPQTRTGDVVEEAFGERIADPYRWLENDVRTDAEVAGWVTAQNAYTQAYLENLPGRDWLEARLKTLFDYERFGLPQKAGGRYFYTRNAGLQNQAPLYVRDGLQGAPRLLIDPNQWAADGATALADWAPSRSGKYLGYSVQDGGTDWRTIALLDAATGQKLADDIRWAKFTGIAWKGDEGFFYSRFPEPEQGTDFQARNFNQALYYHRIGTPQAMDELVYATPDAPEQGHNGWVSHDGRWLVITSHVGTDARYEIRLIDLANRPAGRWPAKVLVSGFDNSWNPVEAADGALYFVTNKDAPRYRIVKTDPAAANPQWQTVVAQGEQPIAGASIVGDALIVSLLQDASTRAALYELDGRRRGEVPLGSYGTAGGFVGEPGDPETFYTFASFNRPTTVYRFDTRTGERSVFAEPELAFDPDRFQIDQRFFSSKDGTRIPIFVVRRKDVAAAGNPVPTLLYAYGGFDISITPGFAPGRLAWLEAGGAYAVANIRGGGEYGKAWHDAGRLANKQNVFDDFAAAGDWLKAQRITSPEGLAIEGRSNGGLLMGAVTNQRPDLFDAVHAAVGVMDMLRFDRFTAGRYWVDDYGYPSKQADFSVLRAYSPYHNIASGTAYPPVIVTTADTDDRVVPGHSFKYTAALQAAEAGPAPHIIRIETRAGHGAGKPTDKLIEEDADVMAFLAAHTGLALPPANVLSGSAADLTLP